MVPSLPSFHYDDALEQLSNLLADKRALALVGAGASISSGYPSWTGLLERLEARLVGSGALAPKLPAVLRDLPDPAWQAEELVHHLTKPIFDEFIRETFREPQPPNFVVEPHHLIARLGFRHFMTTNYDPCLELALHKASRAHKVIHWSDAIQVQDFLLSLSNQSAVPHVVYLHGHYTRPEDVILTESAYAKAYLSEIFQRRLLAIFMTQPVVFVGFSMNDPDLGQLLRIVRSTLGTNAAQHYGIFGFRTVDERKLIARRMQGKYGLTAVFYRIIEDSKIEDHSSLIDLLDYLSSQQKINRSPEEGLTRSPSDEPERPLKPATIIDVKKIASSRISSDVDAVDPHKGKFGGKPEANGRRLYVTDVREVKRNTYMAFTLVVEAEPGARPLKGEIRFQLHPTFADDDYLEAVSNGKATSKIRSCYGAFTVGVTILDDGTRLELDLSELDVFPIWFRES